MTKEEAGTTSVGMINLDQGADDDDYHIFAEEKQKIAEEKRQEKKMDAIKKSLPVASPSKKKVVKF